jgi:hypothetical protein
MIAVLLSLALPMALEMPWLNTSLPIDSRVRALVMAMNGTELIQVCACFDICLN